MSRLITTVWYAPSASYQLSTALSVQTQWPCLCRTRTTFREGSPLVRIWTPDSATRGPSWGWNSIPTRSSSSGAKPRIAATFGVT